MGVSEILWDEVFMDKNTVKSGQSYGRRLPIEKKPHWKCNFISFSFFLKSCVKTSWDSFRRLLVKGI